MRVLPSVLVDKRGVTIVVWAFGVLESLYLDMGQEKHVDVFVDKVLTGLEKFCPVLASRLLWSLVIRKESVGAVVSVEALLTVIVETELLESGERVKDDCLDALLSHLPGSVSSVDELTKCVYFFGRKLRLFDSTVINQIDDPRLLWIIVELGGRKRSGKLCLPDARRP